MLIYNVSRAQELTRKHLQRRGDEVAVTIHNLHAQCPPAWYIPLKTTYIIYTQLHFVTIAMYPVLLLLDT